MNDHKEAIERIEIEMQEYLRRSQQNIEKIIQHLPRTVESYRYLEYCHGHSSVANEKQGEILDSIEQMLYEKYDIDKDFLQDLVHHIKTREEYARERARKMKQLEKDKQETQSMLNEYNDFSNWMNDPDHDIKIYIDKK